MKVNFPIRTEGTVVNIDIMLVYCGGGGGGLIDILPPIPMPWLEHG